MEDIIPEFDYTETMWVIRSNVSKYDDKDNEDISYYNRVFDMSDPQVVEKFAKPQKDTLLHRLIRVECDLNFRVIVNNCDLPILINFAKYYSSVSLNLEDLENSIKTWYQSYLNSTQPFPFTENALLSYYVNISPLLDLIFYSLFLDRVFLFQFNKLTASLTSQLQQSQSPELLAKDSRFKRLTYIPTWLQNGIFKRDQGHCVYCGKDLIGLRKIEKIHLDHIIALSKGGTNDPTNWQLLCEECNLAKSNHTWTPPKPDLTFW